MHLVSPGAGFSIALYHKMLSHQLLNEHLQKGDIAVAVAELGQLCSHADAGRNRNSGQETCVLCCRTCFSCDERVLRRQHTCSSSGFLPRDLASSMPFSTAQH
jgi:hypothetical protein